VKIDAAKALPIIETALLEARDELDGAGLLGKPPSSSRWFIFQLLARDAVLNLIASGRSESRRTYDELQAAWLEGKQGGKDSLQLSGTFSRWAEKLHHPDPTNPSAPLCFATATKDGAYDVKVRVVRPRDDDAGGTAGITVAIERSAKAVEVTPRPTLTPRDAFFLDTAAVDREREQAIEEILATFRTTLRVQPRDVLERLRDDPTELTMRQSTTFWMVFRKVAARASQAAGIVLALLLMAYITAPAQARQQARQVIYVLFANWCPFCDQPGRTWSWTFEHPDRYYSPGAITLPLKSADFGPTAPGQSKTDPKTGAMLEVAQIDDDPQLVRVRIVPPQEFRSNDTKFYINYGDLPERKGQMNHLIVLGPAAVFEHRYTKRGGYPLRVDVARARPAEDTKERRGLPPTESDDWSIVAELRAVVVVR